MSRLPTPGGDSGNWGTILNDYLSQVHNPDGSLKNDVVTGATIADDAVTAASIQDGTIQEAQLDSALQTKLNTDVDWTTLANKPAVIAAGTDAAAARMAIGAAAAANVVPMVDAANAGSVVGAAVLNNTTRDWYGSSYNVGNVGNSFGFSGSPTTTPATTITSNVTFPLSNATIAVADCAQLNANGGSFTLGGNRVVYLGRSASSGAGNATGCYSTSSATGTIASGTALSNTPTGFFPFTIYQRFGYDGRPNPGSTQAFGVVASYRSPTVDDSAEAGSFVTVLADSGSAQVQHNTVTGGEMTAQLGGNWLLPDGYSGALNGGGVRTSVSATDHAKNVIGLKINPTVASGGFVDNYDGVYQTSSALQIFGTLNGAATLPQTTIPVTGTFPPASAAYPVTVRVGCNSQGMGGTTITYTGQSGGSLTGCSGGTGTWASGSNVANFVYGINVKDPILTNAGLSAAASGWSGTVSIGIKGINDSVNSMFSLTGPTNAEVTGGLTLMRLNAGSGQTKSIFQVYDGNGTNRVSIGTTGSISLFSVPIVFQQTGVPSVRVDSSGFIQPGISAAVSSGTTTTGGAKIYSGPGAPNSNLVGLSGTYTTVGDLYIRTDGGTGTTIYRATAITGSNPPTSVTWTGIL